MKLYLTKHKGGQSRDITSLALSLIHILGLAALSRLSCFMASWTSRMLERSRACFWTSQSCRLPRFWRRVIILSLIHIWGGAASPAWDPQARPDPGA